MTEITDNILENCITKESVRNLESTTYSLYGNEFQWRHKFASVNFIYY